MAHGIQQKFLKGVKDKFQSNICLSVRPSFDDAAQIVDYCGSNHGWKRPQPPISPSVKPNGHNISYYYRSRNQTGSRTFDPSFLCPNYCSCHLQISSYDILTGKWKDEKESGSSLIIIYSFQKSH